MQLVFAPARGHPLGFEAAMSLPKLEEQVIVVYPQPTASGRLILCQSKRLDNDLPPEQA